MAAALSCCLSLSSAAWADVPISENASRRFAEGVRYLRTRDIDRYEKAYVEFKAAYADSPSWKILGNLGIVAQALERYGEAIDAFERYLAEGGAEISADERQQIENDLKLLRADHALVTILTTPDGAWIVDERLPDVGSPIVNRYGPATGPLSLRLRSGHHRIRAEQSGFVGDVWEFNQEPGSSFSHSFELVRRGASNEAPMAAPPVPLDAAPAPAADSRDTLHTLSYVAFGLGAAGAVAGGVFLGLALDAQAKGDAAFDRCSGLAQCTSNDAAASQAEEQRYADDEGRARTGSLVSFAAAGAFLTASIVCYALGTRERAADTVSLVPSVGPRWLGVSGRF